MSLKHALAGASSVLFTAQVVDTAEVRKKDARGSRKISVERWILSWNI
jgi:hypothetical protein